MNEVVMKIDQLVYFHADHNKKCWKVKAIHRLDMVTVHLPDGTECYARESELGDAYHDWVISRLAHADMIAVTD